MLWSDENNIHDVLAIDDASAMITAIYNLFEDIQCLKEDNEELVYELKNVQAQKT